MNVNSVSAPSASDEWAMAQKSARQNPLWPYIRSAVVRKLIDAGAEEVGSSDVNHGVFAAWHQYLGDWNAFILEAV